MEIQRWRRRRSKVRKVRNMWLALYFTYAAIYAVGSVFDRSGIFNGQVASGLFIGVSSGSLVAIADLYATEYLRR